MPCWAAPTEKIRLHADCNSGERDEPESFAEKAHEAIEDGFRALKFDADEMGACHRRDAFNRTIETGRMKRIISTISALREAIGFDSSLIGTAMYWWATLGIPGRRSTTLADR